MEGYDRYENLFAIATSYRNNDGTISFNLPVWIFPPDGYQEEPLPVVGYSMLGEPIRQGYPTMTFTWSFMRQAHLTRLMEQYNPLLPYVQVTYIDKTLGSDVLVTAWGMMHEPVIGARQIVYYNNIAAKFTRWTPSTMYTKDQSFTYTTADPATAISAGVVYADSVVNLQEEPFADYTKVTANGVAASYMLTDNLTYRRPREINTTPGLTFLNQPRWIDPKDTVAGGAHVYKRPSATEHNNSEMLRYLYDRTQVNLVYDDGLWSWITHPALPKNTGYAGYINTDLLTASNPGNVFDDTLYSDSNVAYIMKDSPQIYASVSNAVGSGNRGGLFKKTEVRKLSTSSNAQDYGWQRIGHFFLLEGEGYIKLADLSGTAPTNGLYTESDYTNAWINSNNTSVRRSPSTTANSPISFDKKEPVRVLARVFRESTYWVLIQNKNIPPNNDGKKRGYVRESELSWQEPN